MTLKNRIALSKKVMSDCDFQNCMDSNDEDVVLGASIMVGSTLDKTNHKILMRRNSIPKKWHNNPTYTGFKYNFAIKKAYAQVVVYLESGYNVTSGRLRKLLEILSDELRGYTRVRNNLTDNGLLQQYLRKLNDLRMHYEEMTDCEIYDFSFDMVYDLFDILSFSKETFYLSFLIMYWIQRENDLIPIAVSCKKDDFLAAFDSPSENTNTEREMKKQFRLFMRKLLDLHLKKFIKNKSKESKTKILSRDQVLQLIKDNPRHTAKTMASCLEVSVQSIQKQIMNLKKDKKLMRVGPDNGGYWKILNK